MAFKRSLMAAGVPAGQADAILGVDEFGQVSGVAVAATPAEAAVLAAPQVMGVTCRVVTASAAAATGSFYSVRLRPVQDIGDRVRILNMSSHAIRVYPPQVQAGKPKHQLKALTAATGGLAVNAGDSIDLMYGGRYGEGAQAVHRWFQLV